MTLGQRIQELRKKNELSQEGLGEKLGVSRQAVSRWEMDGAVPEVDKLIAMSRIFGVDLNDLLQVYAPASPGGEEMSEGSPEEGDPGELPEESPLHPASWWKWLPPVLALLALVLGVTALGLSFGRKTGELSDRLAALEAQVSLLEGRLAQAAALDPERPLVADFQSDHQVNDGETRIRYEFLLTAAQQLEGMEVALQVVDGAGAVHPVELTRQGEGTIYAGELELPFATGRSARISAVFRAGGMEYTQPLADGVAGVSSWRGEILWRD